MKFRIIALLALSTFFNNAEAQFEQLTVRRQTDAQGQAQICFKEFLGPEIKCVAVQPWTGSQVTLTDSDLKLTELRLTEFSLTRGAKRSIELAAVIRWQGRGAGTLAISGPKGEIFALGLVTPGSGSNFEVEISQFSDASLSQQFDRSVLFGESDVFRLHAKTKIWLEEILKPVLQEYLSTPTDPLLQPR